MMPVLLRALQVVCGLMLLTAAQAQVPRPYTCFTEHIELDAWMRDPKRGLSPEGYFTDAKRYHPLTAATGGILAYERFVQTGDSSWFRLMRDQARYFLDTARVDTAFGGRGLGVAYDWPFGNHKAPWYSGMSQGVAMSLLLRYEHLTRDPAVAPVLQRLAYFMVQPEAQGGTMATTQEGGTWIEEYPLSGEHRHVLNGFINALIGLIEYGARFPGDTLVCGTRDRCLATLRNSFPHFDRVEWSAYDRSSSGLTAGYMQYQILQLKHLFALTGDTLLRDQMLLWTVYAANKPNKEKSAYMHRRGWHASCPLRPIDDRTLAVDPLFNDPVARRPLRVLPGKVPPRKAMTASSAGPRPSPTWTVVHTMPMSGTVRFVELSHDSVPWPLHIEVHLRDTLRHTYHPVKHHATRMASDRIMLEVDPMPAGAIVIHLEAATPFTLDSLKLKLRLGSFGPGLDPWTVHERVGPVAVSPEEPYVIADPPEGLGERTVFYRTGRDLRGIGKTPWRAHATIAPGNVIVTDMPFVELLVVYPYHDTRVRFPRTQLLPLSAPRK